MPHPAHVAIFVRKRMDKFKLVMEDRTANQWVYLRGSVPVEQILNFSRYQSRRRSHMYDYISIKYTYPAGAKFPILRNQTNHHHLMCIQQVFH